MSKIKRVLLHSLLLSCLAVLPVSAFAMGEANGEGMVKPPQAEQPQNTTAQPHVQKAFGRAHFGVYYGRPYYYQPYYRYYPYNSYHYYPYYPYGRW